MASFAFLKNQYVVWDGANLAEIQTFAPTAYAPGDGSLWIVYGIVPDALLASEYGTYVVNVNGSIRAFTETEFLAQYSPTPS